MMLYESKALGGTKMTQKSDSSFLFTVELLLNSPSQAKAVAEIARLLADEQVKDYKIVSGSEVGKWIDQIKQSMESVPSSKPKPAATSPASASKPEVKPASPKSTAAVKSETASNSDQKIIELLGHFKDTNTLVRLSVIKGKGVKLSIPCRILNFDESSQNVSIYHVDEKKVYLIKMNEIDDFIVS
ncbi:SPOR domain-containing protein [Marinicrinis sediminis]|uniref:SPOR domain-containing protein n=1 Tax=Marinicrinis sediminis TaxID=1652465 RepID=A0ABW5R9G4_9BACL